MVTTFKLNSGQGHYMNSPTTPNISSLGASLVSTLESSNPVPKHELPTMLVSRLLNSQRQSPDLQSLFRKGGYSQPPIDLLDHGIVWNTTQTVRFIGSQPSFPMKSIARRSPPALEAGETLPWTLECYP